MAQARETGTAFAGASRSTRLGQFEAHPAARDLSIPLKLSSVSLTETEVMAGRFRLTQRCRWFEAGVL